MLLLLVPESLTACVPACPTLQSPSHVTPCFSRAAFPKLPRRTRKELPSCHFHDSSSHALAKATMTPESDDEFDYDFSVEEEELLLQLASHNDAPAPPQQVNLRATDASDGGLCSQDVAQEVRDRPALRHGDIQASGEPSYVRPSLPTPPPLFSTATLDQEVFYPDRTWSPRHGTSSH